MFQKILFIALLSLITMNANTLKAYAVDISLNGINCTKTAAGEKDITMCQNKATLRDAECVSIISTVMAGAPIWVCAQPGVEYCFADSDCIALGRNKCLKERGSYDPFVPTVTDLATLFNNMSTAKVGICGASGGSVEDNAFGQAVCNVMNIITGKAGRGFVAAMVIVVGITFFVGKISWSSVLAIALGAGAMFGAPALVKVVTGQSFKCS